MLSVGIIGLPNVGKSTLFNLLTLASANVSNYPFCTVQANIGVTLVPDERLEHLGEILKPPKLTHTHIEFIDIAGLVKNAHKGEGLGNQFLAKIREVSAIIHTLRGFKDENIIHIEGSIDPIRDWEIVYKELLFADLASLEKAISKIKRSANAGYLEDKEKVSFFKNLIEHLTNEQPARTFICSSDKKRDWLRDCFLLTSKPVLYVLNLQEEQLSNDTWQDWEIALSNKEAIKDSLVIPLAAKFEIELNELDISDAKLFREELDVEEIALKRIIQSSYKLLDLITFFTIKGEETRAWSLKCNSTILEAANKIHTDIAEGFIKAEVVNCKDLFTYGSFAHCRETGKLFIEGKDYILQDGDVILIHFR